MSHTLSFERLRSILVATVTQLPDSRRGKIRYELADVVLGRLPCSSCSRRPSWPPAGHAADPGPEQRRSLFGIDEVPTDPQIRNLLDPIAPEQLAAPFWRVLSSCAPGSTCRPIMARSVPGCWPWMARSTSHRRRSTVRSARCGYRMSGPITHTAWSPRCWSPQVSRGDRPGARICAPTRWQREAGLRAARRRSWLQRNAQRFAPGSVTVAGYDLYATAVLCALAQLRLPLRLHLQAGLASCPL